MADRRLEGRVAVVTGAGRGIGRAHALALSGYGACVIVNDFGGSVDGAGSDSDAAAGVVREILALGGEAVADSGDVGSWQDAEALIRRALEHFGRLDIVVNNAGILRPRTLVSMTEEEAESVIRVHLLGAFATSHFAAVHWRSRFKADGSTGGRLINTTSGSGLFGVGQANYAAAKAGVAALTSVAANELGRYGATVNAIAPIALTRMSAGIAPASFTPEHAAELTCWLASEAAAKITGQVFNVGGGHISIVDRCHTGPAMDKDGIWRAEELDSRIPELVDEAKPHPDIMGYYPDDERSALLPNFELSQTDQ